MPPEVTEWTHSSLPRILSPASQVQLLRSLFLAIDPGAVLSIQSRVTSKCSSGRVFQDPVGSAGGHRHQRHMEAVSFGKTLGRGLRHGRRLVPG